MNSFTPNYNLDLYDPDDKPNLNDQYNDAMGKIDTQFNKTAQDITTTQTAVNNLSTKVDTFDGRLTDVEGGVTAAEADIAKLKTDVANAQETAENGVSAAHEANELAVQASSAAQTAQTTANQAKATADKNKTDLAAETANRANADTNLQNQINSIIETGNGVTLNRNTRMVFIGDSYAQAENRYNTWSGQINSILGNINASTNGAVSGGGFTTDVTFQQQITNVANSMAKSDRDKVQFVVIAGGRNDIGSQAESTLENAAYQCVLTAQSNFPNATNVIVPMLWDAGVAQSAYDYVKADCYMRGAMRAPGKNIGVNYAWTWLKGRTTWVQSDGIHPNSTGAMEIAHYIISAMLGGYSGRTAKFGYADNNINIEFMCSGGSVHCRTWAGNSPAFPSGGIASAIPVGCRPYADTSTVGYTNSGTAFGIMQYTRAGSFNIYQKSGALGGVQGNTSWIW